MLAGAGVAGAAGLVAVELSVEVELLSLEVDESEDVVLVEDFEEEPRLSFL